MYKQIIFYFSTEVKMVKNVFFHGYKIYVDILTGEKYRQFRLLKWTSIIGLFVHPLKVEEMR